MDFKKIVKMASGLLGRAFPSEDPLNLSAEDKQTLDEAVEVGFAEAFQERYNKEASAKQDNEEALALAKSFMEETATGEDEPKGDTAADDETIGLPSGEAKEASLTGTVKAMGDQIKALINENKKQQAINAKLASGPEPDKPEIINLGKNTMKHSSTHLFASNKSYDAFEGRNWNRLAAGMEGATATEYTATDLSQLNTDIQDYFRKDPKKLHDLMLDALEIPKHWKLISNVSDQYMDVFITLGEVTQGIKRTFIPKNRVKFSAQIGKVRDIQIDLEFDGNDLKKIEKSYLNHLFNEGSKPVKMSYVLLVVEKIFKKARQEDKICIGKGVYAPNVSTTEKGGSYLNNFSGVVKLAEEARGVLYQPFSIGKPSKENIYEYVNTKFVEERLPHVIKTLPNLYLYMSHSWARTYNDVRELTKGGNTDYTGKSFKLDNFPNITIYPYDQLEGSDFMFLTTEDNISILTDKLGEDKVVKFIEKTRGLEAAGDYKLATYIQVFGRNLVDTPDNSYENQLFFSNDVEVLTDVYVPVAADVTTPSLEYHTSLIIGENNTVATDITDFTKAVPGTKVYVKGNSDTKPSTVKNGGNISLIDGDCVLTNNTLLVLYVLADGKFQELYRETVGTVETTEANVVIDADATVIDGSIGTNFITSANTKATAITAIENVEKGDVIRIEGGSDADATTIPATGVFSIGTEMVLEKGKYIELFYNGALFVQLDRG